MATVTSYNSQRMKAIEDSTVVRGAIEAEDQLILYTRDGTRINAGTIKGGAPEWIQEYTPIIDNHEQIMGETEQTLADMNEHMQEVVMPVLEEMDTVFTETLPGMQAQQEQTNTNVLAALQAAQQAQTKADDTVKMIVKEYCLSTSDTIPPEFEDSWVDSPPIRPEGQYIWERLQIVRNNDAVSYTDPIMTTGPQGDRGPKGLDGDKGLKGDDGLDGLSSYTHIAYADDSSGGGFSQNAAGKSYMGVYVDHLEKDSSDPTKYHWSLIKGSDGLQGIQGKAGADGKTPYLHLAWSDSDDGSVNFNLVEPGTRGYLGTYTDFVSADSTDPTAYKWAKIQGEDGEDGEDGQDGSDGRGITSTTIAYVASTSGTTTPSSGWGSSIPSVPEGQFLWTRTTIKYTSGSDSVSYAVSKQGKQGDKGLVGDKGVDGKTSYFHVAYATNAAGTEDFSTTNANNKTYVGTYTDFTEDDSTDPTKYTWQLVKGADGSNGNGVTSSVVTYLNGISGTTPPTGTWLENPPTVAEGQFLWTKTVTTFSDGATTTAYSVAKQGMKGDKGDKGDTGSDGLPGKDGVGLTGTTITYAKSTSGTVTPTSGWQTTVPSSTPGQFLWTRTVWTYTDNSTETGYSVAMWGDTGAKGPEGEQGISVVDIIPLYKQVSSTDPEPDISALVGGGRNYWVNSLMWDIENYEQIGPYYYYEVAGLKPNIEYTMSINPDINLDSIPKPTAGNRALRINNKKENPLLNVLHILSDRVETFERTVTSTEDGTLFILNYQILQNNLGDLNPKGIILKESSVTQDWTPAPEDLGWVSSEPAYEDNTKLYRTEMVTYSNGNTSYTPVTQVGAYQTAGEAYSTAEAAVSKVETFYAVGSPDVAPTSGWTKDSVIRGTGQVIWWKQVTTNNLGEVIEESTPAPFTGDKGDTGNDGIAGKDGVGITDTVITYAQSTSGTTAPTSGWTANPPTPVAGRYIWTKTVWTYSDNTTETGYSVGKIGDTGAKGDKGDNAKLINISATTQVLTSPPTGGHTSPTTAVVTGTATNTTISKWEYSVNGGAFTSAAPAGVTRSGNVVTVTGINLLEATNTVTVKMGDADGTEDVFTVARIKEGASGIDAYTILLSNEAHVFPATSTGAIPSTTSTSIMAFKGTTRVSVNVGTIAGQTTGLSATVVSNNTVDTSINFAATAGLITDSGMLIIPITVDGITFSRTFSWSLSKQGVGIASIVEQYYLSTSATTQTGGSWENTVPEWIDGRYYWTRSVISYSTGDPTITTAVMVSGGKGSSGKGVTKVDVMYYLSTSATDLASGSWQTTAPTWIDGRYMWTKTVTTYTEGGSTESPAVNITGAKGATGDQGDAGVGVESITPYYRITAGSTTTETPQRSDSGGAFSGNYGSVFTITEPVTILQGEVYAYSNGVKTYQIIEVEGTTPTTVVATHTFDLKQGDQVVTFNQALPAGTYWLGVITGGPNVFRSNRSSPAIYPAETGVWTWVGRSTPDAAYNTNNYFYAPLNLTFGSEPIPSKPTTLEPDAEWSLTEPMYKNNTDCFRTERILWEDGTYTYTDVVKSSSYQAATDAMKRADEAYYIGNTAQSIAEGMIAIQPRGWYAPDEPPHEVGRLWIETSFDTKAPLEIPLRTIPIASGSGWVITTSGTKTRDTGGILISRPSAVSSASIFETANSLNNGSVAFKKDESCYARFCIENQGAADLTLTLNIVNGSNVRLSENVTIPAGERIDHVLDWAPTGTQNLRLTCVGATPANAKIFVADGTGIYRNQPKHEVEQIVGMWQSDGDSVWLKYALLTSVLIVAGQDGMTIIDGDGMQIGHIDADSIHGSVIMGQSIGTEQIIVGSITDKKVAPGSGLSDAIDTTEYISIENNGITIVETANGSVGINTALRLDSQKLAFYSKGQQSAYISGSDSQLYIARAVIDESMIIGNHLIRSVNPGGGANSVLTFDYFKN